MIVVISLVIETETMVSLGSEMREDVIPNLDMVVKALLEDVLCPGAADADRFVGVAPLEEVSPLWY